MTYNNSGDPDFSIVSHHCIPHLRLVNELRDTLTPQPPGKRVANLSKDGKWRSFPKVPNLLQYISSGVFFARIKINGKLIRQSCRVIFKPGISCS